MDQFVEFLNDARPDEDAAEQDAGDQGAGGDTTTTPAAPTGG